MIENNILDSLRLTHREANNTKQLINVLNSCLSQSLSTKMASEELAEINTANPDIFKEFYRVARESNATKFLSFYDGKHTTIYAVKGNITQKNIREIIVANQQPTLPD